MIHTTTKQSRNLENSSHSHCRTSPFQNLRYLWEWSLIWCFWSFYKWSKTLPQLSSCPSSNKFITHPHSTFTDHYCLSHPTTITSTNPLTISPSLLSKWGLQLKCSNRLEISGSYLLSYPSGHSCRLIGCEATVLFNESQPGDTV